MSRYKAGSTAPKFLTVRYVAEFLELSIPTVYRLVDNGSLKACRLGTNVRVAPADLQAFVTAGYTGHASDAPRVCA